MNPYLVGQSKVNITFFRENCGMMGYGRHFHYMQGVETQHYVRTYVFEQDGQKVAIVCAEFCFCTDNLKLAIVEALQSQAPNAGWQDANIMILGQHTHSTAGGYSQYPIYNFTTPGFQVDVFEHYRDKLVESILAADQHLHPAKLSFQTGEFDKDAEVCFNRALPAYNQNPEVKDKINHKNRHLAADRTMRLLRIDAADSGETLGLINWFGVHTTSVSNRLRKVCFDNKGYAAEELEGQLNADGSEVLTAFMQEAAGDISPNFNWSLLRGTYSGKHKDDYESAAYNGHLQAEKAKEIFEKAPTEGLKIQGGIDFGQFYADMTFNAIEPKYTNGAENQYTGQGTMGLSFLEGTTDGRGMSKMLGTVLKAAFYPIHGIELLAARMSKDKEKAKKRIQHQLAQRPKAMAINLSLGAVVGTTRPDKLVIPSIVDPILKYMKLMKTVDGNPLPAPWGPERLPLQLFIIGQLAFVGIPAEITTIAGQRLRQTILDVLKQRGVEEVVLCPYANSYSGYITTPEEYRVQMYEGGHTLFGQWTLPAYQKQFEKLAQQMLEPADGRQKMGVEPFVLPLEKYWHRFADDSIQVL
jgi:neutral ceramidase